MPRGGKRTGSPGTNYSNRSDLASPGIATYKGLPYGGQTQLTQDQQAVPVGPPPTPGAGGPAPQAPQGPTPGSLGALGAPSARPLEPVTHGLPSGPGGGPEVMPGAPNVAKDLIARIAAQPLASPDLQKLLNSFQ